MNLQILVGSRSRDDFEHCENWTKKWYFCFDSKSFPGHFEQKTFFFQARQKKIFFGIFVFLCLFVSTITTKITVLESWNFDKLYTVIYGNSSASSTMVGSRSRSQDDFEHCEKKIILFYSKSWPGHFEQTNWLNHFSQWFRPLTERMVRWEIFGIFCLFVSSIFQLLLMLLFELSLWSIENISQ